MKCAFLYSSILHKHTATQSHIKTCVKLGTVKNKGSGYLRGCAPCSNTFQKSHAFKKEDLVIGELLYDKLLKEDSNNFHSHQDFGEKDR